MTVLSKRLLKSMTVQLGSTEAGEITLGRSRVDPDSNADGLQITSTLTGSVHTTVNALREAIAVQRMLERDARGGTRYIEIIKAQFGVPMQFGSTESRQITLGRSRVSIRGLSNLGDIKTGMTTTKIFRTLKATSIGLLLRILASRLYSIKKFIIMVILMMIKSLAIKSATLSIVINPHLYMGNFGIKVGSEGTATTRSNGG
jgi:hypothetical protein